MLHLHNPSYVINVIEMCGLLIGDWGREGPNTMKIRGERERQFTLTLP